MTLFLAAKNFAGHELVTAPLVKTPCKIPPVEITINLDDTIASSTCVVTSPYIAEVLDSVLVSDQIASCVSSKSSWGIFTRTTRFRSLEAN